MSFIQGEDRGQGALFPATRSCRTIRLSNFLVARSKGIDKALRESSVDCLAALHRFLEWHPSFVAWQR
jgi:hypothetical protein